MADRTAHKAELSREEVAEVFQRIASELREEGPAQIPVGNKLLTLSPPRDVTYRVEVEERSPLFSGNREKLTVEIDWKADRRE